MRLESEAGISDPSDDLLSGDQHSLGEIRLSHRAHQTLHSDLFCRVFSKKIPEGLRMGRVEIKLLSLLNEKTITVLFVSIFPDLH